MELTIFKEKLTELYNKSQMEASQEVWPLVYDADEGGVSDAACMYISEDGILYLANKKNYTWIEAPFRLEDIAIMKYWRSWEDCEFEHNEDDEPTYSYIYIYFSDGSYIEFEYSHTTYCVYTTVYVETNAANDTAFQALKESCEGGYLKIERRQIEKLIK